MYLLLLSTALYTAPTIYAQEETTEEAIENIKPSSARQYIAHLLTGGTADLGALLCIGTGFIAGANILDNAPHALSNKLGLTEKGIRCKNTSINAACTTLGIATIVTGFIAGCYVIYKTPLWTDKYILGLQRERDLTQKIDTFGLRILLRYPLGLLLGEYIQQQRDQSIIDDQSNCNSQESAD